MVVLYHGTSSKFVEDIMKNGLCAVRNTGKYSEIRQIFSKYMNPDVLTDEFFDKALKFVFTGRYREYQAKDGDGPFGVVYNENGSDRYFEAPAYAKFTTTRGGGEFEETIIQYLNSVDQGPAWYVSDFGDRERIKEIKQVIRKNINPKYVNSDGTLYVYKDGSAINDFPVLIRFEVPDSDIIIKEKKELRVKHVVRPDQITGVAFLPSFRYNIDRKLSTDREDRDFDKYVPDLKFLSKEEFFKELERRQKKQNRVDAFEVKDNVGNTEFMFSFPTDNTACVQKIENGKIKCAYFYARDGLVNNGLIAKKVYENGLPAECLFLDTDTLRNCAKVLYQQGKPVICKFFSFDGKNIKEEAAVKKVGSVLRISSNFDNRLDSEQLFILGYERQPQAQVKQKRSLVGRFSKGSQQIKKRTENVNLQDSVKNKIVEKRNGK